MPSKKILYGKVIELHELKEAFGVGDCGKNADLNCGDCRFNNFGENRATLGETCGIDIILRKATQVYRNYKKSCEENNMQDNDSNLGIIF